MRWRKVSLTYCRQSALILKFETLFFSATGANTRYLITTRNNEKKSLSFHGNKNRDYSSGVSDPERCSSYEAHVHVWSERRRRDSDRWRLRSIYSVWKTTKRQGFETSSRKTSKIGFYPLLYFEKRYNSRMKKRIKKQVWLPIDRIVRTNPNLNREVVDQIKKNCSPLRFWAIPWAFTKDYHFKITDGNHRVQAMQELGFSHVPCIVLSPEEFQAIACSDNHLNFIVRRSHDFMVGYSPEAESIVCRTLEMHSGKPTGKESIDFVIKIASLF